MVKKHKFKTCFAKTFYIALKFQGNPKNCVTDVAHLSPNNAFLHNFTLNGNYGHFHSSAPTTRQSDWFVTYIRSENTLLIWQPRYHFVRVFYLTANNSVCECTFKNNV